MAMPCERATLGHNIVTMSRSPRIAAGEFKAKCLSILDLVAETKTTIVITKHGRPVAELVPITTQTKSTSLRGSVKFHGDIVAPLEESWDVDS